MVHLEVPLQSQSRPEHFSISEAKEATLGLAVPCSCSSFTCNIQLSYLATRHGASPAAELPSWTLTLTYPCFWHYSIALMPVCLQYVMGAAPDC